LHEAADALVGWQVPRAIAVVGVAVFPNEQGGALKQFLVFGDVFFFDVSVRNTNGFHQLFAGIFVVVAAFQAGGGGDEKGSGTGAFNADALVRYAHLASGGVDKQFGCEAHAVNSFFSAIQRSFHD